MCDLNEKLKKLDMKQISARIRQARTTAGFKVLAEFNEIMVEKYKWSASRLESYEAGKTFPEARDVCILANETDTSPGWIMFGEGPICPEKIQRQAARYQNFRNAMESVDQDVRRKLFARIGMSDAAAGVYLENPFQPINDKLARRIERALDQKPGWLDATHVDIEPALNCLPVDMSEMLTLYAESLTEDKIRFVAILRALRDVF